MKYQFAAFSYDLDQKILSYGSKPIEITKKNHELLHHLLSNPNRLISRDELIDCVWHGRVVTNNTIDQCILKLRKSLNQAAPGEYIESVYGQGIRFLPAITTHDQNNEHHSFNPIKVFWVILTAAALGLLLMWFIYRQVDQSPERIPTTSTSIDVVSQSTINTTQPKGAWLLDGAKVYLPYLINQHPNHQAKNIRFLTPANKQPRSLAINVVPPEGTTLMLIVNLEQMQAEKSDAALYQASLAIRDGDITVASNQLTGNQLTQLFPQMVAWMNQQLGHEQGFELPVSDVFTADEFALQSFLKAQSSQASGDSQQALVYLQTAVEQDPEFKMAWYEMAIALRKQADPRKAIGILNAIQTNDNPLAFKVALVKAQCLDTIGEFSAAEAAYQLALKYASANNNLRQQASVFISQAILWRKTKQFNQAEVALQEAMVITDAIQQPHLYGTILSTYAKLAREIHQPDMAIEMAEHAIKAFQSAGDLRYQMQAKTTLASILRQQNRFKEAEQLVKESLFHAEQLKHRRGISDNRTKLARIYQQTGRFRLAHEEWQKVLALNAEIELYGNTADAYLWLLKLHFAENNLAQADIDIKMLQQLFTEHPNNAIRTLMNEAQLLLALKMEDVDQASQYLRELEAINHPLLAVYQGDLAQLNDKYEAAELHYLKAMEQFESDQRPDRLAMVLNRLNALYLLNQPEKLVANLIKTEQAQPFIYPIQKYQAQAAAAEGKYIHAISLLEELKLKAGDYWQYPEQLILEQIQSDASSQ